MEEQTTLIHQAKLGNPQAFAKLYEEIYRDLYRFAWYLLKNSHDAEDLVSETVMDAWAGIRGLKKEESFRAWMFRILSNKCRKRLKEYLSRTEELPEHLESEQRNREEDMDVKEAFSRLEEEERLILSLRIFGGYSSKEIGTCLNMNDATVRSRQKRALEKMQRYLA